jgi:hypothetical protein
MVCYHDDIMFGLLLCAAVFIQSEPDLMAKSKVLFKPGAWTVQHLATVPSYTWINSHEVIYKAGADASNPNYDLTWYRMDAYTLVTRELPTLRERRGPSSVVWNPMPNPKGTKLLWETMDSRWRSRWLLTTDEGTIIANWSRHARSDMPSALGVDESWDQWSLDGNSIFECESHFDPRNRDLNIWRRDLSDLSKEVQYPNVKMDRDPDGHGLLTFLAFDLGSAHGTPTLG